MSTHLKARRLFLFLSLFFFPFLGQTQLKAGFSPFYDDTDPQALYNLCMQVKEDSINRLCTNFLNERGIRKNREAFLAFCGAFKNYCKEQQNMLVYRRMAIIELHGQLRFDNANPQLVSKQFEGMHEACINKKDYPAALECLFELSQYLHRVKDNIGAIKILFYADKFAKEYNLTDKISYHGILHKSGYIMWELEKPHRSIDYFKNALTTGEGILFDSLVALNGIGINYQKLDSLQESLKYFKLASETALRAGKDTFNTIVLGGAAATLQKMGALDTAMHYCNLYKNISYRDTLWSNAAEALYRMVQIELQRKNIPHAKRLLDSLQGLSGKLSPADYISFRRQKEATYLFYNQAQDYKNALSAYKEYVYYDSLFQDYSNKNRISELELNAAVRLYEEDMLKKERKRKWRNTINDVIIAVLLIVFSLLILYVYKKMRKTQKEKKQMEKLNIKQASEIEELKKQLLEQISTIRNFNNNFKLLSQQQKIEKSPGERNETVEPQQVDEATEAVQEDGKKLLSEFNLTQKEQWKAFRNSFAKMYPDFEKNIVDKIGPVSGAELRLMMLHKIGLSNKEIAETLLISAEGVKKGNYRLYKRIGISTVAELVAFLNSE